MQNYTYQCAVLSANLYEEVLPRLEFWVLMTGTENSMNILIILVGKDNRDMLSDNLHRTRYHDTHILAISAFYVLPIAQPLPHLLTYPFPYQNRTDNC